MAQNVRFFKGTKSQYLSLSTPRNQDALYFCLDTQELYLGDLLLSDGIRVIPTRADLPDVSCAADGILYYVHDSHNGYMVSPDRTDWIQTIYAPAIDAYEVPEDEIYNTVTTVGAVRDIEAKIYKRIDEVTNNALNTLTPVDGTIKISDIADGGKSIGVAISPVEGNSLVAVEGGLFVPTVVVPEYSIEKQETAETGYSASYRLKKTVGDEISYVGDTINIAKDMVLQSATLETVEETDVPYIGAVVGDPYIKMVFNDENTSNLYIPVKGLVDKFEAGSGIEIIDNLISVKLAANTHGLVAVDGALTINLATKDSDGAMSKEDKRILDAIPSVYVARKYDISGTPKGTLVNYGEKEIRVMCPADSKFEKQAVGVGGDANTYYMTFKTYAPQGAVGYKEHLGNQSDNEILTDLKTDEHGRRYQPTWLGIAKLDEVTSTWSYYGKNSSVEKYVGWDYRIDWFDANNVMIATDSIRINLSNEDCHNNIKPYYMANFATSEEVAALKESIANAEDSYTWCEM